MALNLLNLGATFSIFLLMFPSTSFANNTINGIVQNGNISNYSNPYSSILSTVMLTLAIKTNNLTQKTPLKLNDSTHDSIIPRIRTIYYTLLLYCPLNKTSSNQKISENSTFLFDNNVEATQNLCIAPISTSLLKVVGISLASGLGVALLLPLALYLVMFAIGFTAYGVVEGSKAAMCQSRIGDVESGSWFANCQSVGAHGLKGMYKIPFLTFIWISSSLIVAYFIWDLF